MASLYITRATVNLGGNEITDFKAFSEQARVVAKMVPLMHKTGVAQLTRRFHFTLTYVVPNSARIDWESFIGAGGNAPDGAAANGSNNCTVTYDDGSTVSFHRISVIEVGEATVDGENELTQVITFLAEDRDGATE